MTATLATPRARTYAAWALQVLLAAAFLGAGFSKLAGVPMMIDLFDRIGLGQWLRLVTGAVEIGGAALLLIPGLAGAGAALLATTMAFAVLTHLVVLGDSPVAALALLALNLALLALRRDQATRLARPCWAGPAKNWGRGVVHHAPGWAASRAAMSSTSAA